MKLIRKKNVTDSGQNLLLSQHIKRSTKLEKTGNDNVLILSGAGRGRMRYCIKPNILEMNASYVIFDTSGEYLYSLGQLLKDNHYKPVLDTKYKYEKHPLYAFTADASQKNAFYCREFFN